MSGPWAPTVDTHGLRLGSTLIANLRGSPFGLSASHRGTLVRLPAHAYIGPGGVILGVPRGQYLADRIELQLENVPLWQFEDYRALVAAFNALTPFSNERPVTYSPLGSEAWDGGQWTLLSTTAGWVTTRPGILAGPVVLARRGDLI